MNRHYMHAPFHQLERQHHAVGFGMWVFLVSEMLLFAGLFAGYTVYRGLYPEGFATGANATDVAIGTLNTFILMTSSFSIAVAGRAAKAGLLRAARLLLFATFGLGLLFLILKGIEYREDISKALVPGPQFALEASGAQLFFSFYWVMTGIHALHVTCGLIAILRLIIASAGDRDWLAGSASQEATALYWHLVDVVWIILYPLLYLTGRAHG